MSQKCFNASDVHLKKFTLEKKKLDWTTAYRVKNGVFEITYYDKCNEISFKESNNVGSIRLWGCKEKNIGDLFGKPLNIVSLGRECGVAWNICQTLL